MSLAARATAKRQHRILYGRVGWIGAAFLLLFAGAAVAVPPGTAITNVAQMTYAIGAQTGLQALSNEVRVVTVASPTPSSVEVLAYAPDSAASQWIAVPLTYYSASGSTQGPYMLSPQPIPLGASNPFVLSAGIPLLPVSDFRVDEPVFVRVTDPDQNLDTLSIDTVLVAVRSPWPIDGELLRLAEVSPNAGVFAGYIQSRSGQAPGQVDGSLAVANNSVADLAYVDPNDPTDRSSARARFQAAGEQLFVSIRADRDLAALGEFIRYTLRLENTGSSAQTDVALINTLPPGVRYQAGSCTRDGASTSDPFLDAWGRTLRYDIASLPVGTVIEWSYVVQVARTNDRELINSVYAEAGPTESNRAAVTVALREDLFRNTCLIMGQVRVGDCGADSTADSSATIGLPGARIYLEDGTAVLTDRQGFYHFEAVSPGTHVVQLDLADLADRYTVRGCAEDDRHAGRGYSQFVELSAGTMWRADFTVEERPRPAAPEGKLELDLDGRVDDSVVRYTVAVANTGPPVTKVDLAVMLPPGMTYRPGSSVLDHVRGFGPGTSGRMLTFGWDSLGSTDRAEVAFEATYQPSPEDSQLSTRAVVTFDTPARKRQMTSPATLVLTRKIAYKPSPLPDLVLDHRFGSFHADLSPGTQNDIRDIVTMCRGMQIVQIEVTGHSDDRPIRDRSRHLYADNYALSRARAQQVGTALADALGLDPSQVTVRGAGADHPAWSNDTEEGRDLNRRVEVRVVAERADSSHAQVTFDRRSDRVVAVTEGRMPERTSKATDPEPRDDDVARMPQFSPEDLDTLDAAPAILWPMDGCRPAVPSLNVAVKHGPEAMVRLYLNGRQVAAYNVADVTRSRSGQVVLSRWAGIDLRDGHNVLLAAVWDSTAARMDTLVRDVYYAGPPVHAEFDRDESTLFADGMTPIVVAVRLSDRDGEPARAGVIGDLSVDPPFVTRQEHDALESHPLTGLDMHRNQYEVGSDGLARIRLMPTSHPGEVVLHFHFRDHDQELRAWLDPRERDWIVVGLTEGTVGYRTVRGNMEALNEDGLDDRYYADGRTAFFAKGQIKGKWLLTLAYDSDRRSADADRSLERQVDPDAYYTVYGDATEQTYDAPAGNKLYVKMERRSFYALFGDFTTGLTVTELTRYNRSFNGAKAELHRPGGQVTAFVSESRQAFVKDELVPDGTSGPYQLTRAKLVANSEHVAIETRDRYRSEIIVSRRALRRHIDYSIDYLSGRIDLREPLAERDADLNAVFLIVDYEALDQGDQRYTYGGRAAVRAPDRPLELGASFIHEGAVGRSTDLGGVDTRLDLTPTTTFKAELAWSARENDSGTVRGRGYLAELSHHGGSLTGRAYVREQERGFGAGQQNAAESGTRKLGFEATQRFRERFAVDGLAYREFHLAGDGRRDLAQLRLNYSLPRWHWQTGYRWTEDHLSAAEARRAEHLTLGSDYWVAPNRFRLRIDHEQAVGKNESRDFPSLTRIGAEYLPLPPVTLFAEQEYSHGEFGHAADIRIGSRARPWTGSQLSSTLDHRQSESGERLFSTLGLRQSVRLGEHWSVDGSVNHTRTISETAGSTFDGAVSPAVGSPENYTAIATGVARRSQNWSWTSRLEFRDGEEANKYGFTVAAYGEPARGVGLSAASQVQTSRGAVHDTRANIRLGSAYRPSGSRWIALNRLDVLVDRHWQTAAQYDNWRVVHNGNVDVVPRAGWQWSLQLGSKYVRDVIDRQRYSGFTGLVGTEIRRDLSAQWDFGFHGSVLHSFAASVSDYSAGMSIGRSIVTNSWLSLGYNIVGFDDGDFTAAGYTAKGPFIHFRFKFDQESPREIARLLGLFRSEDPWDRN